MAERRRREKTGYTWLLIDGEPMQMPDVAAGRYVRMEMALSRIRELASDAASRSSVRLIRTLADEVLPPPQPAQALLPPPSRE